MAVFNKISLLVFEFFSSSDIIWYERRTNAWYRSTRLIGQCASTGTIFILIEIYIDEALSWNYLFVKFDPASVIIWSGRGGTIYTLVQQDLIAYHVFLNETSLSHLATWKRVALSITRRFGLFLRYTISAWIELMNWMLLSWSLNLNCPGTILYFWQ